VVGINPAPVSVAAGHSWQGSTGRTLWRRLRRVGQVFVMPGPYESAETADATLRTLADRVAQLR
jgi:hypothetical protein